MMENNSDKTIFIFAPHPDDETLGCGGTIIKKLAQGYIVKVVILTDGSHSHSSVHDIWTDPTPQQLAEMREKEARAAIRVLGVPEENLTFFRFEDGLLSQLIQPAVEKITKILLEERDISEVYVTHAEDEHADHKAANAILQKSLAELGENTIEVFYYVIWGKQGQREFGRKVEIDISGVLDQKIDAIQQYRSQITKLSPEHSRPILEAEFLEIFTSETVETFWQ